MDVLSGPGFGAVCALGSALTWAVITLIVRTLSPIFNSVTINAVRTTAAGVLLVAWVLVVEGPGALASVSAGDFALLALSIVVASALGDTVFFESSRRVGVAPSLAISMTYPLMAAGFAAAVLGEALTPRTVVGAVLTLGGLALIVTGRGDTPHGDRQWWLGFALALLASLAWAVSAVLLKAPLREMDATTAQALRMPVSGLLLFMTPWSRGAGRRVAASPASVRWQLAALCVLTVFSGTLFTAGVKYAGVAVGTVLSATAPMWALPLGYLVLGERLAARTVVGLLVTVAGIVLLQ